jgi:hypothetical protein
MFDQRGDKSIEDEHAREESSQKDHRVCCSLRGEDVPTKRASVGQNGEVADAKASQPWAGHST